MSKMTSGVLYFYKCVVKRVIDGDTIDVVFDLGFDTSVKQRIRLYGINTPETRTRDKVEKQKGLAAKKRLNEILKVSKSNVYIKTNQKGKYGRYLGTIYVPLKNHSHYADLPLYKNHSHYADLVKSEKHTDIEIDLVELDKESYINVNQILVQENHAEIYYGGKR